MSEPAPCCDTWPKCEGGVLRGRSNRYMAWLPAQDRHQRRLLQLNFDHAPTQGYVEEFFGGNGATLRRWCECGGDRRPGRARACADHTASLTVQLLDPHVYADGALDAFEGS